MHNLLHSGKSYHYEYGPAYRAASLKLFTPVCLVLSDLKDPKLNYSAPEILTEEISQAEALSHRYSSLLRQMHKLESFDSINLTFWIIMLESLIYLLYSCFSRGSQYGTPTLTHIKRILGDWLLSKTYFRVKNSDTFSYISTLSYIYTVSYKCQP